MAASDDRRHSNQTLVERLIRIAPGITRGELAQTLGLSVTTVNPLVAHAIERGRVVEQFGSRGDGAVGRPKSGLVHRGRVASFATIVWSHGVLRSAVVGFDGSVHAAQEESIDPTLSVPHADDIMRIGGRLLGETDLTVEAPRVIVLSLPAPYEYGLDTAGRFRDRFSPNAAGRWFSSQPATALKEALGVPVIVENDSNLAALGEARVGAGRGADLLIYLRLSDRGIGSGFIVDGQPVTGADGFAGEISHARVDSNTMALCTCGSRGCLRTLLGPHLLEPLRTVYGPELTYPDLLELVERGEPGPIRVLEDAGRAIAVPLAPVVTFVNPSAVVIEAGSETASSTVIDGITSYLRQSMAPFIREALDLRPASLGPSAVDAGALLLARSRAIGDRELSRRFTRLLLPLPSAGELATASTI